MITTDILEETEVAKIVETAFRGSRRICMKKTKKEREKKKEVGFCSITVLSNDGRRFLEPKYHLMEDGTAFRKIRRIEKKLRRKASRRECPVVIADGILEWEHSESRSTRGNQAYSD